MATLRGVDLLGRCYDTYNVKEVKGPAEMMQ